MHESNRVEKYFRYFWSMLFSFGEKEVESDISQNSKL